MKSKKVAAFGLSLALLAGGRVASGQSIVLPPGYAPKSGFPKQLNSVRGHSGYPSNEPVWADLGLTGGRKSIIVGTSSKELYVVNFDSQIAPGWPQLLPGQVMSSAAVGDLGGGNGNTDIVVGFGGGSFPPADPATVGGVRAFKRDGTVLWTVYGANDIESGSQFPLGVVSTPAIGDIDGDGHNDVVWGSWDAHIYAVDGHTGLPKAGGWPLFVRDTIWSSPALYDLNGDGKLEIIIGTDTHAEGTANPPGVPPTIDGGRLHVLTYLAQEVPGFPKDVDEVIDSSPVVGDIDGDGRPEIIHGTGTYYSIVGGAASSKKLYAWKCDGSAVPGWPVTITGRVTGSPALADLDGDGVLDVIASQYSTTLGQNVVAAYKSTGGIVRKLWETAPLSLSGFNLSAGQPVVADVLFDSTLEVLVPTNSEICILDGRTGAQLTAPTGGFSLYMPAAASSAALDVESGILNIAAASQNSFSSPVDVTVYAWTTTKITPAVWSAYRYDARRQGVAPNAGVCCGTWTPAATNTGPYCIGSTISLSTPTVSGATYSWTGPNGFTSAVQNPTISNATAANAGTYSVKVTTVAGCTSGLGTTNVVVGPPPAAPVVTAFSALMAGSPNWTANVPAHVGSTYAWGITNGTITAGQGTSQITFTAGTAGTPLTLSVAETTASGCVTAAGTKTITVTPAGPVGFFYTVTPCRQLDTRSGAPISPGGTLAVTLTGAPCGIPSTATSVSANAVATQETSSGHLTIYPADKAQPLVSSINFNTGQTRPNNTLLGLSRDGTGRVNVVNGSGGTTHVVIDVNGYFQ
jgi:hypothetical protein